MVHCPLQRTLGAPMQRTLDALCRGLPRNCKRILIEFFIRLSRNTHQNCVVFWMNLVVCVEKNNADGVRNSVRRFACFEQSSLWQESSRSSQIASALQKKTRWRFHENSMMQWQRSSHRATLHKKNSVWTHGIWSRACVCAHQGAKKWRFAFFYNKYTFTQYCEGSSVVSACIVTIKLPFLQANE